MGLNVLYFNEIVTQRKHRDTEKKMNLCVAKKE